MAIKVSDVKVVEVAGVATLEFAYVDENGLACVATVPASSIQRSPKTVPEPKEKAPASPQPKGK